MGSAPRLFALAALTLAAAACGDTASVGTQTAAPLRVDKHVAHLPDLTATEIERVRTLAQAAHPGVVLHRLIHGASHPGEAPYVMALFTPYETGERIRRRRFLWFELDDAEDEAKAGPVWTLEDSEPGVRTEVCPLGRSFLAASPVPESEVVAPGYSPQMSDAMVLAIVDAMSTHIPDGERLGWIGEHHRDKGVYEVYTVDATRPRGLHGSVFALRKIWVVWLVEEAGSWVS